MKKTILFSLMLVSFVGFSQVPNKSDLDDGEVVLDRSHSRVIENMNDPNYIHTATEIMPEYTDGGIQGFRQYISKNFRTPDIDKNLKGQVIVKFVIEPDGSLSNVELIRDLGYGTGQEAVRVVSASKKWKPGIQDGKKVRVNYMLPIMINIQIAEDLDDKEKE